MKKARKKVFILIAICLVVLIGAIIADRVLSKSYLVEIKYNELVKKMDNKESFILLLSQTTCAHCMDYKPKLESVANKYEIEIYYIETNLVKGDNYKQLLKYFNFESTPTTVFVTDGEEKTAANRINGDVTENKIISKLKNNGYIE